MAPSSPKRPSPKKKHPVTAKDNRYIARKQFRPLPKEWINKIQYTVKTGAGITTPSYRFSRTDCDLIIVPYSNFGDLNN